MTSPPPSQLYLHRRQARSGAQPGRLRAPGRARRRHRPASSRPRRGLQEILRHSCKSSRLFPDSGINSGNGAGERGVKEGASPTSPRLPSAALQRRCPVTPQGGQGTAGQARLGFPTARRRSCGPGTGLPPPPSPPTSPLRRKNGSPGAARYPPRQGSQSPRSHGESPAAAKRGEGSPGQRAPRRGRAAVHGPVPSRVGSGPSPRRDLPSPASCRAAPGRAWLRGRLRPHGRVPRVQR